MSGVPKRPHEEASGGQKRPHEDTTTSLYLGPTSKPIQPGSNADYHFQIEHGQDASRFGKAPRIENRDEKRPTPPSFFMQKGSSTFSPQSDHPKSSCEVVDPSLPVKAESGASARTDAAKVEETETKGHVRVSGFTFNEIGSTRASTSKVYCCHFSSDGKLLATGGHDKKAVLWYVDSLKPKSTLEEHSLLISDVRFSPSMPRLATSSFDRTVRVWDADNVQGYSLRTFTGHSASVMSLDFHPNKDDLICSSDADGEVRYWSINNGSCVRVFKGGTIQMRFQPRQGKYLAAARKYSISILDVETQAIYSSLQGHTKPVDSVCWDPSGDYLASVSEDSVRVWSFGTGGEGECVHELTCVGKKFHSCVFHPTYPYLLVIGCYQSLELWDMREGKTMTLNAHEQLITALAVSNVTDLIASTGHDKVVKLWK